ncbi:MAG: hypothetical protein ACRCTQ_03640 [Brevinemataceae bacterium]
MESPTVFAFTHAGIIPNIGSISTMLPKLNIIGIFAVAVLKNNQLRWISITIALYSKSIPDTNILQFQVQFLTNCLQF